MSAMFVQFRSERASAAADHARPRPPRASRSVLHHHSQSRGSSHMPEQKCLTIDGTQVFYKIYRKKQGTFDIVKLCIGPIKPEKQWTSHHLAHEIVNSCKTTAQLAQAVRVLAGEAMGVAVTPKSIPGCQHCKQPEQQPEQPQLPPTPPPPPPSSEHSHAHDAQLRGDETMPSRMKKALDRAPRGDGGADDCCSGLEHGRAAAATVAGVEAAAAPPAADDEGAPEAADVSDPAAEDGHASSAPQPSRAPT